MATGVVISCGGTATSVTLSYNIQIPQRMGNPPRVKDITFPGQDGSETLYDGRNYESVTVTGWITGSTMTLVDTAMLGLEAVLAQMAATSDDKIVITYADTSVTTYTNLIQEGTVSYGDPFMHGSNYGRAVSFTVRRMQ